MSNQDAQHALNMVAKLEERTRELEQAIREALPYLENDIHAASRRLKSVLKPEATVTKPNEEVNQEFVDKPTA